MKTFITHHAPLKERKEFMLVQLNREGMEHEFIELFAPDDFDVINDPLFPDLCIASRSVFLKHIHAYECIILESLPYALILEDDAILPEGFLTILQRYAEQLPTDFDLLYLGDGTPFHIPGDRIEEGQFVYPKCLYPTAWGGDGAGRSFDSYIISLSCAAKTIAYFQKETNISLPIDWWMNKVARDCNFKPFWAEPTIVMQGSKTGLFGPSY